MYEYTNFKSYVMDLELDFCLPGFYGTECDVFCTRTDTCSGRGYCSSTGTSCVCDDGYDYSNSMDGCVPTVTCDSETLLFPLLHGQDIFSGRISDSGNATLYGHKALCIWNLLLVGAKAVNVKMLRLDTEPDCDELTMSAMGFGLDESIGEKVEHWTVSGSLGSLNNTSREISLDGLADLPKSIVQALVLNFTTDATVRKAGWTLAWEAQYCLDEAHEVKVTGEFGDGVPNYLGAAYASREHMNYPVGTRCSWTIVPESTGVRAMAIVLSKAILRDAEMLSAVSLDDSGTPPHQFPNYVDEYFPATVVLAGSAASVVFVSPVSAADNGYDLTFSGVWRSIFCEEGAPVVHEEYNGVVEDGSPWEESYWLADGQKCEWIVRVPSAKQLFITATRKPSLSDFDSLAAVNVNGDPVELSTLNENPGVSYIVVPGNEITFTLVGASEFSGLLLESRNEAHGFEFVYVAGFCSGRETFSAMSGSFTDGSAKDDLYGPGLACEWLISIPNVDHPIGLTFTRLETEEGDDQVTVFACENMQCEGHRQVVESFSGDLSEEDRLTNEIIVDSGVILVVLNSDPDLVTAGGFEASWRAVRTAEPPPSSPAGCASDNFTQTYETRIRFMSRLGPVEGGACESQVQRRTIACVSGVVEPTSDWNGEYSETTCTRQALAVPSTVVAASVQLADVTVEAFTPKMQDNFKLGTGQFLGVPKERIVITGIADVTVPGRHRRNILAANTALQVAFEVIMLGSSEESTEVETVFMSLQSLGSDSQDPEAAERFITVLTNHGLMPEAVIVTGITVAADPDSMSATANPTADTSIVDSTESNPSGGDGGGDSGGNLSLIAGIVAGVIVGGGAIGAVFYIYIYKTAAATSASIDDALPRTETSADFQLVQMSPNTEDSKQFNPMFVATAGKSS